MIVLSDTSPLNYLVLIGHVDILPALFVELIVPSAVRDELRHIGTPDVVRRWMANPPSWLSVRTASHPDASIQLGAGEIEAISLAIELRADLILMDDRLGRRTAEARGLSVAGTLNVIEAAAHRELLDFPAAVAKLRQTNFHISERLINRALLDDAERRKQRGIS